MVAGTSRRIGYFTATFFLIFLLIVLLVVPVNITFSSQTVEEEQFPQSIIAASSTDTTPHALELRAIQDGDNAEPRKVSGFRLDMTNVVSAQINSQVLVFVTDSSVRIIEAKVKTVTDQLIDLVPSSQANAFSLANLPVGVYTLDVMTQKGNAKAAYEGILVISQRPTTVISETTRNIINQVINQNTRVVIDDDGCPRGWVRIDDGCEPFYWCGWYPIDPIEDPGICPPGTTGTLPDCEPIDDIALPTDEEDQETEAPEEGGDEFEGDEGESGDGDEQGGEEGGNQ